MDLFDAHLHLDDAAFTADRDAVVARAIQAGIIGMVTAGTDLLSSRAAVALAERSPAVYAAVGIHPDHATASTPEAMAGLTALGGHPKVVAVGETGLDYGRSNVPREAQRQAFMQHIQLSRDLGVPLVIHCREAYPEVLELLSRVQVPSAVMHAFSGSVQIAQACVARGYFLSIAGPVTFRRPGPTAEVAQQVPAEFMLVESDAPVLTPEPLRGRRNEPAYLVHTIQQIAFLRQTRVEDIAALTTANATRVYAVG